MKYRLVVKNGAYESESLFGLLLELFLHRLQHLRAGDGFID